MAAVAFCSGRERTLSRIEVNSAQHGQVGLHGQRAGWGTVDGKFLREKSGVRGYLLNRPNRTLTADKPGGPGITGSAIEGGQIGGWGTLVHPA